MDHEYLVSDINYYDNCRIVYRFNYCCTYRMKYFGSSINADYSVSYFFEINKHAVQIILLLLRQFPIQLERQQCNGILYLWLVTMSS